MHGLSLNAIAKLLQVSIPTVLRWVRTFAREHYKKPSPEGSTVVIELDELCHYVKKNLEKFGSGKPCVVLQGDYWTGKSALREKQWL